MERRSNRPRCKYPPVPRALTRVLRTPAPGRSHERPPLSQRTSVVCSDAAIKRTPRGFDQLNAAIRVCRAYLLQLAQEGKPRHIRV